MRMEILVELNGVKQDNARRTMQLICVLILSLEFVAAAAHGHNPTWISCI